MSAAVLTLQQAAEQLGVHYMTAYRYVRLGVLPASKVGGTWHVAAADVESFAAQAAAPDQPRGSRRRAPWASRLEARLVAGDARGAWGVVEAALAAGTEIDEVYLDLITPAMESIGRRWASGELDVSVEHRATGIAFRLVGQLSPRFARRGRSRGSVLIGAPVGERHSLPVALLADLLRGDGWDVSDLGVDLPVESFVHAATHTSDLVGIGVSVTTPECTDAAADLLAALRRSLGDDVFLAVGGFAIRDTEHAHSLGAHGWAESAAGFSEQLAAVAAAEGLG